MMTGNNISVIIPTYNRAALIGKSIESVLSQTRLPEELIIIDDGSTDNTAEIVKKYQENSKTTIIYTKQKNRGPAAARNKAITMAASKYIAFLDSDDFWQKKKLEIQSKEMEEKAEFKISHTMERWLRRGKHLNQKKIHQPPHGYIFRKCLELCCVGMSTVMVHKELFDEYGLFNEALPCCEDYDYWLRVAAHEAFLLIEKKLTIKNGGREDQVSAIHRIGMDRYRIMAIVELLEKGKLNEKQMRAAQDVLKKKCQIYGQGCLKHGKKEEGDFILGLITEST